MSHSGWSQRASSERPMHPHLPSGRVGGVARRQVPGCRSALLLCHIDTAWPATPCLKSCLRTPATGLQ